MQASGGVVMELVIVVGLAVWFLFGWWGGLLAASKGRSRALGAVLGLALGLFGVILVALLPTNRCALFEREEAWRQPDAAEPTRGSMLGKSPPFRW